MANPMYRQIAADLASRSTPARSSPDSNCGPNSSCTPMRLTVTVFLTDRNQFIVNVGAVPAPTT
jgi:hypothetical protein